MVDNEGGSVAIGDLVCRKLGGSVLDEFLSRLCDNAPTRSPVLFSEQILRLLVDRNFGG